MWAVVRFLMILFTNGKQKDRVKEINVEQDLKTILDKGIIYYILTLCTACLAMRSSDVVFLMWCYTLRQQQEIVSKLF